MNNQERQELIDFNRAIISQHEAYAVPVNAMPSEVRMLVSSARVALAALEAPQPEPVAYTSQDNLDALAKKPPKTLEFMAGDKSVYRNAVSLYTAPPAPVMQPVKLIGGSLKSDGNVWYKAETVAGLIVSAGYPVEQ